jgi:hypothetical protein
LENREDNISGHFVPKRHIFINYSEKFQSKNVNF